jgi:predicted nucleotidyltransferase
MENMEAKKEYDWAVTAEKVELVIRKIIDLVQPLKIILFGSYINGTLTINSDLDVLVITGDDTENPRKESVRIRRALRGISMPMDILVVPQTQWEQLKDQPGMIYREAHRTGKVVYEI